jgi:tetratricopeptide (TPR) repeat protein
MTHDINKKGVFISYRRDATGKAFARVLKLALVQGGYDVFLDVDSINAGLWEEQILAQVPQRPHFLLLLTPGALDDCVDPNDWVRKEYELAKRHNRNVVPICQSNLDQQLAYDACPQEMRSVFTHQVTTVDYDSFDRDVAVLLDRFISPAKAPAPANPDDLIPQRIAPARLGYVDSPLVGRDRDLAALDAAWADFRTHILTIVGIGGMGKTSLVGKWASRVAAHDYYGADYFDWSFYSQGQVGASAPSSDPFVSAGLEFFGDAETARSALSPWDKGRRLAQLVTARGTLLILDGLEPLQHSQGVRTGQLRDPAVTALLQALARRNPGLCIVTTREPIIDLSAFRSRSSSELQLGGLSAADGSRLLRSLGVRGRDDELRAFVEDVGGHPLTLDLAGRFLRFAHGGDVRRRDRFSVDAADGPPFGARTPQTVATYVRSLAAAGEKGGRLATVLDLLGLFDRPATEDSLAALRRPPVISGLTDSIVSLTPAEWARCISGLVEAGLVTRIPADDIEGASTAEPGELLDAHPLVRAFLAERLRLDRPDAWRAGHSRLFEHLRDNSAVRAEPTLDDLQPFLQAIGHGCQAGRFSDAFEQVYLPRIDRSPEGYLAHKLGAFGANLAALAPFFSERWRRVTTSLSARAQAWVLNEAAFSLRALGRLRESLEPLSTSLTMAEQNEAWGGASAVAINMSDVQLALGDISAAIATSDRAVAHAAREGEPKRALIASAVQARALDQAGDRPNALRIFREAETIAYNSDPEHGRLYSVQGFFYCELILAGVERQTWRTVLGADAHRLDDYPPGAISEFIREVEVRAGKSLQAVESPNSEALDYLSLGRSALYRWTLDNDPVAKDRRPGVTDLLASEATAQVERAVGTMRRAALTEHVPRGLLTRALLRFLLGDAAASLADLDEAWEIAGRGPMPLHQADVHLHRARLFRDRGALREARRLIERHGYWRRRGELEDAEEAAKGWP